MGSRRKTRWHSTSTEVEKSRTEGRGSAHEGSYRQFFPRLSITSYDGDMRAAIFPIQLILLLPTLARLPAPGDRLDHRVGEVVDRYPGGELRRRYRTNRQGQKHGPFKEYAVDGTLLVEARYAKGELDGLEQRFFSSGEKHVVANWSAGLLNGRYDSFYENGRSERSSGYELGKLFGRHSESSADGEWILTAVYRDDLLNGSFEIADHGETLTAQVWKAGVLREIDGIEAFPRTSKALLEELATILAVPEEPEETDPIEGDRAAALRRLQAYRSLCNVPWEDMSLVPEWNELCNAAAEVCRRLGRLDHTPARPKDTDDELFSDARKGASKSNLAAGRSLCGSVDAYMYDSDASNIDRVGHRRWCLNPPMVRTGFGWARGFSAMWSRDVSGAGSSDVGAVLFPPPGYVPTQMFGKRHAWSITPASGALPEMDKIVVSVQPLGEYYLPEGEPLELDFLTVSREAHGSGPCLIFRPDLFDAQEGLAYRCRVSFDGGRTQAFDYIVEFVSDERLRL